jgi:hypothetical protein
MVTRHGTPRHSLRRRVAGREITTEPQRAQRTPRVNWGATSSQANARRHRTQPRRPFPLSATPLPRRFLVAFCQPLHKPQIPNFRAFLGRSRRAFALCVLCALRGSVVKSGSRHPHRICRPMCPTARDETTWAPPPRAALGAASGVEGPGARSSPQGCEHARPFRAAQRTEQQMRAAECHKREDLALTNE